MPLPWPNSSEAQRRRASQILYRCFEEVGSTRAALFLREGETGDLTLAAHFGWPRHFPLPQVLTEDHPLRSLGRDENKPFIVQDAALLQALAPFQEALGEARFLLAPLLLRGEAIGLLVQRDRSQGLPYAESRDLPLTWSICQELVESLDATPQGPPPAPAALQPPIPVTPPPSETLLSSLDQAPVLNQEPARVLLAGSFLPEQRIFFWEVAEILFQVLPLSAAALWMEESTESRPILVYSRRPLSGPLKREIQAAISAQLPELAPSTFRLLSRVAAPGRESLDGNFGTCLPLVLEGEGGRRDLLLLCRQGDKPFAETELQFARHIARLTACHLQETRLHERYHRAFLSVSQQILGSATELRAHSLNTARLARNLALRLGLATTEVEAVSISATLHDVGSLLLDPDLPSRGRLSPEEMARIREHPVLASTFLKDFQFPFDVPTIIRHHHERWDGSGYPDGLQGEEIPMGSRIIALIETFEVMTAGSGYRPPVSREEALAEIRRSAGTQFDPGLAQEFLALMASGAR